MSDMPHYLGVISKVITGEFPDAEILAPCQVFGKPGAIGVIVKFPIADGGEAIESDTDQKVSFVVGDTELDDDAKLERLARLAMECRRHFVRSDFVVRGNDKLSLRQRVDRAMRRDPQAATAA